VPAVRIGIQVTGATALKRALKAVGETDAPFLRQALDESGNILSDATRSRAKGSIAGTVHMTGVQGVGGALRATVEITHPGAKAMEFGRHTYYKGFKGRQQKATGQKFRASRGQQAKPFVGVKEGGQAVGASRPDIERKLTDAMTHEWERLAGAPD
jgi:hypothetical protein